MRRTFAIVVIVALAGTQRADARRNCRSRECYDQASGFCRPIHDLSPFCTSTDGSGNCVRCAVESGEICRDNGCGGFHCAADLTDPAPQPALPPLPPLVQPPPPQECPIPPPPININQPFQFQLGGRVPINDVCREMCFIGANQGGDRNPLNIFTRALILLFGPCSGSIGAWLTIDDPMTYTRDSSCRSTYTAETMVELKTEVCGQFHSIDVQVRKNVNEQWCKDCPNPPQQECTELNCKRQDSYGQGRLGKGIQRSKEEDAGWFGKITGEYGIVVRAGFGLGRADTTEGACQPQTCETCTDKYMSVVASITGWIEFTYNAGLGQVIGGADVVGTVSATNHEMQGGECQNRVCVSAAAKVKTCVYGGAAVGAGGILFGPGRVNLKCWDLLDWNTNNC